MIPTTQTAEEWNRYVERATGTNPFYRTDALVLQAEETNTTPYLLAGFKGQEPVGIFPIFEYQKGPIRTAFSPAPQSWTCDLGPAMLNIDKCKQRKADRRVKRFIDGCLEWIDREISPVYCKFTVTEFEDVRPFVWNEYTVEPKYTYVLDLSESEEDLLDTFSSDARNNVRSAEDTDYTVEIGTGDDVERIVGQVQSRYENQGRPFHLRRSFARSLYETLPDGAIVPYTCRIDDTFQGGILVCDSNRTRYRWQGGVKPETDVDISVNDLLDWHVIRDGVTNGFSRYDLVGAGVPSINRYKAKFNPHLEINFAVTTGSFGIDLLVDRYRKVQ